VQSFRLPAIYRPGPQPLRATCGTGHGPASARWPRPGVLPRPRRRHRAAPCCTAPNAARGAAAPGGQRRSTTPPAPPAKPLGYAAHLLGCKLPPVQRSLHGVAGQPEPDGPELLERKPARQQRAAVQRAGLPAALPQLPRGAAPPAWPRRTGAGFRTHRARIESRRAPPDLASRRPQRSSIQPWLHARVTMPKPHAPSSTTQRSMAHRNAEPGPIQLQRRARLAIALGDPAGIGAEVALKALAAAGRLSNRHRCWWAAAAGWRAATASMLRTAERRAPGRSGQPSTSLDLPWRTPVQPGPERVPPAGTPASTGSPPPLTSCRRAAARALVRHRSPRPAWHAAGHPYPGQTERLAETGGNGPGFDAVHRPAPQATLAAQHPAGHRPHPAGGSAGRPRPGADQPQTRCAAGSSASASSPSPAWRWPASIPMPAKPGQLGAGGAGVAQATAWTDWRQRHPQVDLEGPLPPDTCWLEAARAWRGDAKAAAANGYLALLPRPGPDPGETAGL
jgi:4-hydroxythreonine-4-phosphate dehydrogenase